MRKYFLLFLVALLCSSKIFSQQSTLVTQTVDVNLANVILVEYVSTGTQTGGSVPLSIGSLLNLLNGITSGAQQLVVKSTKGFNITAKTTSANFTYTGTGLLNTIMPIANRLKIQITQNATGGTIAGTFGTAYTSLSSTAQSIINNGTSGTGKTFSVQYQGIPGLGFALGTYSASVVFTATQL